MGGRTEQQRALQSSMKAVAKTETTGEPKIGIEALWDAVAYADYNLYWSGAACGCGTSCGSGCTCGCGGGGRIYQGMEPGQHALVTLLWDALPTHRWGLPPALRDVRFGGHSGIQRSAGCEERICRARDER